MPNQNKFLLIFILFLVGITSACLNTQIPEMTIKELKNKMAEGSLLIILDVRTTSELTGPLGKIDGVVHINIDELESRIDELEKYKNSEIAVICRSGVRSARGTKILNKHGFNAKNIIGGMVAYRKG